MNNLTALYDEQLNILSNLMELAQSDGRADKYRKYAKEYSNLRELMEEEKYLNAYA